MNIEEQGQGDWLGSRGAGGFDLRSDTKTSPTATMLAAIQTCASRDDIDNEDEVTQDLEAHMAKLTGKESALFTISGIMGNQLGMRTNLTQPPHSVLCDSRAHIAVWEPANAHLLSNASLRPIVPDNGLYLTLEDIQAHVVLDDDSKGIHACPTRLICLESPCHGVIFPLKEVRRISSFARMHSIKMHCDGARLWEAAAAGAGTLLEYCEQFDTVSMCFSKGLSAPAGGILLGSQAAIKHCRRYRVAIGGAIHQPALLTVCARVAVDEVFGTKPDGSDGKLKDSHQLAKEVSRLWQDKGGSLIYPTQTNMCWVDLKAAKCSEERFNELGEQAGLKLHGNRIITHYQAAQNREEIIRRLEEIFTQILTIARTGSEQ